MAMFAVGNVAQGDVVTRSIQVEENDAEEHVNPGADDPAGTIDLTSSDLEFMAEGNGGLDWQVIGIQYDTLGIPQGATINSATIAITVDNTGSTGDNNITIFAEAVDNSTVFASTLANITSRSRTTASVAWVLAISPTDAGLIGTQVVTPDISAVIQEVVNRPGWSDNNLLTLMIYPDPYLASPTGGTTDVQEIEMEAFPDNSGLAWNDTATITVDFTLLAGDGDGDADPGEVADPDAGMPVAGALGLGLIAAVCALGGAASLRRKR